MDSNRESSQTLPRAQHLDESLNLQRPLQGSMVSPQDDETMTDLSEVYGVLRGDAKVIVGDLQGGVRMWREAAAANVAAAGFLLILALTAFRQFSPMSLEGAVIIAAQVGLAGVLLAMAGFGFRKYSTLTRRYAGLFQRAKKLV